MRYVSDDPIGVGTHEIETVVVWRRRIVTETEITGYEQNRRVSFDYVSGPFRVRGSRTFEPVEQGTRFTFDLESQAVDLLDRMLAPLMAPIYQRQLEGSAARMRTILETNDRVAAESAS